MQDCIKITTKGCRDGSVFESTFCSCTDPCSVCSTHVSQPPITPALGDPISLSDLHWSKMTDTISLLFFMAVGSAIITLK